MGTPNSFFNVVNHVLGRSLPNTVDFETSYGDYVVIIRGFIEEMHPVIKHLGLKPLREIEVYKETSSRMVASNLDTNTRAVILPGPNYRDAFNQANPFWLFLTEKGQIWMLSMENKPVPRFPILLPNRLRDTFSSPNEKFSLQELDDVDLEKTIRTWPCGPDLLILTLRECLISQRNQLDKRRATLQERIDFINDATRRLGGEGRELNKEDSLWILRKKLID